MSSKNTFFAFLFLFILTAFWAAPAFAEVISKAETLTAWEMIVRGGWTMIPLALLSIVAVGLAFHSYLLLDPKGLLPDDLLANINENLAKGKLDEARNYASRHNSVAGRIFAAGMSVMHFGEEKVSDFLSNAGRREMDSIKRRIAVLGYIGVVAPLFGLLGTVLGMIRAFRVVSLANDPIVRHEKSYLLAKAIWEAMITTAAGLLVGIFALLLFYYFNGRLQKVSSELEAEAERFALALSTAGERNQ